MKRLIVGLLALGLILLGIFLTYEVPFVLLFGWGWFLARVIPQIQIDRPSLTVGIAAIALFALGVHWIGRSWNGQPTSEAGATNPRWRWRWTLSIVAVVFLLFAAGTSIIGITHQTGWLLTSPEPLLGSQLRHSGGDSAVHLRMMGLGANHHHDQAGVFPANLSSDGTTVHSWETALLAYVGYSSAGVDWNRPWDHPSNQQFFKTVPYVFINPDFRTTELTDSEGYGLSHYAANSHVLGPNKAMKITDITDGTSNTILFGEVNIGFKPWGDPVNWRDPAKGIGSSPQTFGGPKSSGGALFTMCDASVRFFSQKTSRRILEALATPAGGEDLTEEDLGEKRSP